MKPIHARMALIVALCLLLPIACQQADEPEQSEAPADRDAQSRRPDADRPATSQNPELQQQRAESIATEPQTTVPPPTLSGSLLLKAQTISGLPIITRWDLENREFQQQFTANQELLRTAESLIINPATDVVIIEQSDRSLVSYNSETGLVESLYIEPLAEEAGPKSPAYHPGTDRLVFTRFENKTFKLMMMENVSGGGNKPVELYATGGNPIVSPVITPSGGAVYFGIMDLVAGSAGIRRLAFSGSDAAKLPTVPGDLQQIALYGENNLAALAFQNLTGSLMTLKGETWQQLGESRTDYGDLFSIDNTGTILAIPIYGEQADAMLFISLQDGGRAEIPLPLDAERVVPLLYFSE